MSFTLTFTIAFHALSIGFMSIWLLRLFKYLRKIKFHENHHTLLFGFLNVWHFVFLYLIFVVFFAISSIAFVQSLA